jgi:uncharacterized protein (TIGR03437 family)
MSRRDGHIPRLNSRSAALPGLVFWLGFGCLRFGVCPADAQTPRATVTSPSYTISGIVNAATGLSGPISPNAIVSLYGTNLAFGTTSAGSGDTKNGVLPTTLGGVTVYVDHIMSGIFFVSPNQINFVVPYELDGASTTFFIVRQNLVGPLLTIPLTPVSPAFFQWHVNHAVAQHADGSLISPDSPAQGGEVVVLYTDGLGRTSPDLLPGHVSGAAVPIVAAAQVKILVGGNPCPPSDILYAGVTPGFAGLYQINVRLPETLPPDAEIRVSIGSAISPAGIQLYTR